MITGQSTGPDRYVSRRRFDQDMINKLYEITEEIANGRPIKVIIDDTLSAIAELFGMSDMVFEVLADDLVPVLLFSTYGYPEEKLDEIRRNLEMGTDYYPEDWIDKEFDERFKISRNAYFIRAEEWNKYCDVEPHYDHPVFYRHPEEARRPRKSPDEWHESDFFKFALRDEAGQLMASLEVNDAVDMKLPDRETVECIEVFTELTAIALEKVRSRLRSEKVLKEASQKTELLEDVLRIASSVVSERDLRKLSEMILSSVSTLFGFTKATLIVHDESIGAFRWMAVFGYPEDIVRESRLRSIPTEVIMEDLREDKRIGRSVYFTPFEELSARQISYYVALEDKPDPRAGTRRQKDEFRVNDLLAFALHDSSGRIVGVIYPADPVSGKLPDRDMLETLEIFTSLAEVAIESARLSHEKDIALRVSAQKTEQLSRILDLTSHILVVRQLHQMLEDVLKTLAQLLGLRRMVVGVRDEEEGVFRIEATYGYSEERTEAIKRMPYTIERVEEEEFPRVAGQGYGQHSYVTSSLKGSKKMGRHTFYMPAEGVSITKEELVYYPEPELLRLPRKGPGYWHELDFMDTLVLDKNGVVIAYLELLKPRDDRMPDAETVEIIEVFAILAGIAIENARMFEAHIQSRKNAEFYTDLLSHDIKNFNQAIVGYLDLLKTRLSRPDDVALVGRIVEQEMNMSRLASNVRTMSRVTFGEIRTTRTDLGAVLLDCIQSVGQYHPARSVKVQHDLRPGACFVKADELLRELFVNILTNAVKYDSHETVEIEVSVKKSYSDDRAYWRVSVGDNGQGIPDELKEKVFSRFSDAPKKKGSGLGLHIVKTLAKRYRGRVWVEDRVKGDHAKGTVFKVDLPALD